MPTSVLLSIKPEFAEKILSGRKRYEFRRVIFKTKDVSRVVIYASHPVHRVVGEFAVDGILELGKTRLWEHTKQYSGIAETHFRKYFKNSNKAYAIKIIGAKRYPRPIELKRLCPSARPPQSFMYLPQ